MLFYPNLEMAVAGTLAPADVIDNLALVALPYFDFEGELRTGQLVVDRSLVAELQIIFKFIANKQFRIARMTPVVAFAWDDNASMAAGNTSAFNFRTIAGTDQLSNHSLGKAIDINPHLNPYDSRTGEVLPAGATYDPGRPGTLARDNLVSRWVIEVFHWHGWRWLGDREEYKDRHHFEKVRNAASSK